MSFNNNDTYTLMQSIIKRNYLKWDRLFGYSQKKMQWYGTEFHHALVNDIKKYKYCIGYIEYALLRVNNPAIRWILITIRKLSNKLHFIKPL